MKYKLIKWYPGCKASLGAIVEKTQYNTYNIFIEHSHCPLWTMGIKSNEVENNPEFWKEVIEYPIGTRVYNSQTYITYTKKEDGWYKPSEKTSYTDESITKAKHINVVKREVVELCVPNNSRFKVADSKDIYTIIINDNYVDLIHEVGNKYPKHVSIEKANCFFKDKNWVLIKEKDYEILNVLYKNKIYDRFDGTYYYDESCKIITDTTGRIHISTLNSVNIHSIKRLSDGEVFSIGDKVKYSGEKCGYENYLINNFTKVRVGFLARNKDNTIFELISEIKHVKKPLFTTEDGVGLFNKYDICFYVRKNDNFIGKQPFVHDELENQNNFIFFSSKQAAEEYVSKNKPKYSEKNMLEFAESKFEEIAAKFLVWHYDSYLNGVMFHNKPKIPDENLFKQFLKERNE